MKIGTRSLLFGSHQFIIHPLFVYIAWRRLYGRLPRPKLALLFAFWVHDWGYWGKGSMDGEDGLRHPEAGALLVSRYFDVPYGSAWFRFTAGHSRSYAALVEMPTSMLMRADKLATALYPRPLYALLCWLSGEWLEYRDRWVASINPDTGKSTYPGKRNDGVWAWSGHLQANWARFKDIDAPEGRAYGGE